jgi:hypothetical protein
VLKSVKSAGKTRQDPTKKPSFFVINEHFKEDSNAVLSSAIVIQHPAKETVSYFKQKNCGKSTYPQS